jgi:hypothetical protein
MFQPIVGGQFFKAIGGLPVADEVADVPEFFG